MNSVDENIKISDKQDKTNSYRSIFRATSLFGGVQVYQILIGIIKSKFIAILLGPAGMGIQGLYMAAIQLVQSFTSLGLSQSAVRDVSEANGSGDAKRIGETVSIVRRLVWVTGFTGMLVTILLSPILSKTSFGNYDYVIPFIILSVILLIDQICVGQKVVLQGMRRLKDLAKASAIGVTVGLFVAVPLFYFCGTKGIVPALILYSATSLILSWYYSNKIKIEESIVKTRQAFVEGKSMLKMGVAMSVNAILGTLFAYAIRAFIRYNGGIEEVGLYAAGYIIMNTYVGMVFNAMSTDYYPRLSAVNKYNEKCKEIINQQGEVALLLLAPIVVSCIIFMPFIIRLVYSENFLPAYEYILWGIMGMLFKAASWVISFVFLAKAESRLFIVNETITQIYGFGMQVVGYYLYGLSGLGIATLLIYVVYLMQVYIIAKKKYDFGFSKSFCMVFVIQLSFTIVCFMLAQYRLSSWIYVPTAFLMLSCSAYSIVELDKRMSFMKSIKAYFINKR